MAFEGLSGRLSEVFKKLKGRGKVKESDIKEVMREVRMALLEADVNYKVAKDFVASVSEKAMGSEVLESLTPAQQIIKIVNDELTELMGSTNARITFSSKIPTIIMMCGLQGAGKTTHCAKLARYFKQSGKRPLLAACDVYRPAAIQQLQIVGEQAGVPVFEMGQGDPVEIASKAVLHARDYGNDILILDTAGRLHIDEELMDELRRIAADRNCKKEFVQKARHTLGYLQLCMDIARGRHADVGALQKDFESSRAPLHRLDVQYRIALALRHRGDRTGMEKSREYLLENSGGTCYGELARAL